jgi:hypothetical protein
VGVAEEPELRDLTELPARATAMGHVLLADLPAADPEHHPIAERLGADFSPGRGRGARPGRPTDPPSDRSEESM